MSVLASVTAHEDEGIESILKRFKQACTKSNIVKQIRLSSSYRKPGVKRNEKHRMHLVRLKKAQRQRDRFENRCDKWD